MNWLAERFGRPRSFSSKAFVKERLAGYKWPAKSFVTEALPRPQPASRDAPPPIDARCVHAA
jgi:hypothetical protein